MRTNTLLTRPRVTCGTLLASEYNLPAPATCRHFLIPPSRIHSRRGLNDKILTRSYQKGGMKWFLHYFFTELAVLPHRVSVLLHCKRERGLDSGFRRCPVLSLPLPAFSVSPFAKRLLTAVRSAFARPHRTASPPPPQATKHIINKITKNNYEKNNYTTFLSIPLPDDCRVLGGGRKLCLGGGTGH